MKPPDGKGPWGGEGALQRWVLLAAFGLFVVVCDGYLVGSVLADRGRSIERETARYQATARLLAAHSARALEASDALLKRMADLAGAWDLKDAAVGRDIHGRVVEHIAGSVPLGSAWIVDGKGLLVLESWGYPTPRTDFSYRDYYRHHVDGNRDPFLGVAQTGTASGKRRFTVSRAVRREDGSLKAVVVAGVFSEDIAEVFDEVSIEGPVVSGLVRDDRGVLALGTDTTPDRLADLLAGIGTADTAETIVITHPVVGYPAVVVLGVPVAMVLEPWLQRSAAPLAIGVLATLAFGLLVRTGMRAAGREQRHKAELEASNRLLELRVRERTAELDLALEEARQANQAKDNFLATVSHDLRQPLQAMSLLAGVVSSTATDDRTRTLADHVSSSLTYGQRLLNDLVDFSQIEAGVAKIELADVDLSHLAAEVAAEADGTAREAGVRVSVRACPIVVHSDPVRLRQMVQNLVSNAIKHTPEGGRVLIAARRSGDGVKLQVWDTGEGIPPDKTDAVFRQFYQIGNSARNSAHGVGLGLAIVRRTAELLGSSVSVRSRLGKGSVFTITLGRGAGDRQASPALPLRARSP